MRRLRTLRKARRRRMPRLMIRKGALAIMGSTKVTAVAALRTAIVQKERVLAFHRCCCGVGTPAAIMIMTKQVGSRQWLTAMQLLKGRLASTDDPALHTAWTAMTRGSQAFRKRRVDFDQAADRPIDVPLTRVHGYQRQLMNLLVVIYRH